MARKQAKTQAGPAVKISVSLSEGTHSRLRHLCVARKTTATEFVAGLVEAAVKDVRLPYVPGSGETADDAA